jgi:hypothetical protein
VIAACLRLEFRQHSLKKKRLKRRETLF